LGKEDLGGPGAGVVQAGGGGVVGVGEGGQGSGDHVAVALQPAAAFGWVTVMGVLAQGLGHASAAQAVLGQGGGEGRGAQ
jgi:hypothetical protein